MSASSRTSASAAARRRIATAWAAATLVALALLAGGPGISRDEAAVLAAAERPRAVGAGIGWTAPAMAWATHALASPAGASDLRAPRLGSALAGAALSALLAAAAYPLGGVAAALLAPALFWLAPRHLHAGLVATPELALAALVLGAVLAWRFALAATGGRRLASAAAAGALVGAAVAARADAWVVVPALALHALVAALLDRRAAAAGEAVLSSSPRGGPLGAATALAVLVLVLAWPEVLRGELSPFAPPRGSGPMSAPAAALLALPASLLLVYAAGAVYALGRVVLAFRRRAPASPVSDDVLLLATAAAALAGSALAWAPPGARPALHAMPLLALLGARALLDAAALAWPRRAVPLAATAALLVLYPAARAAARAHPHGSASWGELVGGAPGAASLALPRADGGDAAFALLGAVNDRAPEGARVWWPSAAAPALAILARDGRLRADLVVASGPDEADVVVVAIEDGSRDAEYRAWSALRTSRPVAGVYADEVPLALVYARAGAWR